ncbi:MAG TPA: hypothetical protein PKI92_00535 [Candidatus Woesebacteria bacterium]|nr:hypothetical protein [Candidatus Woesebacteria bacterium]HOY60991.1 hypothetical protein [Candidatus Woesebacteria bacterium]HPR99679.1 hypothetical protein [Candidatus Woesebacteria bacterium]
MLNRILVAIALALFVFRIAFSLYYSRQIVAENQIYTELSKKYTDLKYENENLEINYAQKNAVNRIESF